jgi:putative Holliday junction resolvase
MRLLGIDYGMKRIGIALSDPQGTMALPFDTILVRSDGSHIKAIHEIVDAYQVDKVVVGLPFNMNGSLGTAGDEVIRWGKQLETALGLPVVFWDERLTTSEAHEILTNMKVKGKRRKRSVDKIAASIILKGYLDSEQP